MFELPEPSGRRLTHWRCGAALFAIVLAGCSNGEAFTTTDLAKCQSLGFPSGTGEHGLCLRQVRKQRTSLAEVPEDLRD